ncbi:MAG: hypothetical protein Q8838_02870, partial [Candidatus Phytoplasma australasiaticum]|nr:hypothetical protein [Candidatus Phytoplasma australasiaticum]
NYILLLRITLFKIINRVIARHVEHKDEQLGATKITTNAFVAESSSTKSSGFKCKIVWKKKEKGKETDQGRSEKKHKPNSKKGKRFFKEKSQEQNEVLQLPCSEAFHS